MGRICALLLAMLALLVGLGAPASATTVTAVLYFPLDVGDSWTYLENGVDAVTETVVPGTEIVGGISTVVLLRSGGSLSGSRQNFTNDTNGLRLHRQFDPGPGGATVVFREPLLLMPAVGTVGQSFGSSGLADIFFPGLGTCLFSYQVSGTLTSTALINVPLGVFDTVRVDSTLTISGSVLGQPISITDNDVNWLALGIGVVKNTSTADGITFTDELIATNVPEPGVAALRTAMIAALGALTAARSRTRLGRPFEDPERA